MENSMRIVTGYPIPSLGRFLTLGLIFMGFAFCAAPELDAQDGRARDGVSARIYHLEGNDFSLTLNDEQTSFRQETVRGDGINLERTGIVHTGAGTFLEIQLIPSGTVIKLSENTSFVYNGFDENGKFIDLGLLYGRLRVVTNGMNTVVVRSGAVSARIEDGDLGVDYFLRPGDRNSVQRPPYRFYVFRGSVEVFPYGQGREQAQFGSAQSLAAEKRESLTLEISTSYTFADKQPLGKDIIAYWRLHNFAGSPPLQMPDVAIAEAPSEPPQPSPPEVVFQTSYITQEPEIIYVESSSRRDNRAKNSLLSIGLFLTASSMVVQGVAYYQSDIFSNDTARDFHTWSYIPLGLGFITTLVGILINPASSLK